MDRDTFLGRQRRKDAQPHAFEQETLESSPFVLLVGDSLIQWL